jgi:hypothetical protein
MKLGVILRENDSKKIVAIYKSFSDLSEHLKMTYTDVTFETNIKTKDLLKDSDKENGRYIILNDPIALLVEKIKVKSTSYVWSDYNEIKEICSWETIPFDLTDDDSESTESHISIGDATDSEKDESNRHIIKELDIEEMKFNVISVICGFEKVRRDVDKLIEDYGNYFMDQRGIPLVISKIPGVIDGMKRNFSNVIVESTYNSKSIDSMGTKNKRLIIVDDYPAVFENDTDESHLTNIIKNAKVNGDKVILISHNTAVPDDIYQYVDYTFLLNTDKGYEDKLLTKIHSYTTDLFPSLGVFNAVYFNIIKNNGMLAIYHKSTTLDDKVSWMPI